MNCNTTINILLLIPILYEWIGWYTRLKILTFNNYCYISFWSFAKTVYYATSENVVTIFSAQVPYDDVVFISFIFGFWNKKNMSLTIVLEEPYIKYKIKFEKVYSLHCGGKVEFRIVVGGISVGKKWIWPVNIHFLAKKTTFISY